MNLAATERVTTDSVAAPETILYGEIQENWTYIETNAFGVTTSSEVGPKITPLSSSHCAYAREWTVRDWTVPNFHARKNRGEIFCNPYSKIEETRTCSVANQSYNENQYIRTEQDSVVHSVDFRYDMHREVPATAWLSYDSLPFHKFSSEFASVRDLAVTKAKANADLSQVSVLATIGELKETVVSLHQIFSRAGKILSSFRFDEFDDIAKYSYDWLRNKKSQEYLRKNLRLQELEKRYMEARYSIRPLCYEVIQYLKAFNKRFKVKDRQTFRAQESVQKSDSSVRPHEVGIMSMDILYTTKYSCQARAGLLCQIDEVSISNFLGMDQVLETSWELTPLSFVVDWFLNIGTMLAAWTPETGLKVLSTWVVTVEDVFSTATIISGQRRAYTDPKILASSAQINGAEITKQEKRVIRTPDTFPCVFPRLKISLDALKLLDLAVLFRQFSGYK